MLFSFVPKMRMKALFLLTIFMLNIAAGFCCVLNLCHKDHHQATEHHLADLPVSSVGFHHHQNVASTLVVTISKDETCCQCAAHNFASPAKLLPQSVKGDIQLSVAFIIFHPPFALITVPNGPLKGQNLLVKRQRPPTQNIRITIQSFQI